MSRSMPPAPAEVPPIPVWDRSRLWPILRRLATRPTPARTKSPLTGPPTVTRQEPAIWYRQVRTPASAPLPPPYRPLTFQPPSRDFLHRPTISCVSRRLTRPEHQRPLFSYRRRRP